MLLKFFEDGVYK